MAEVIVTFKVMPTGTDVDLANLEKEIKSAVNPKRITREPIAFGLVALNVTTLVEDAGGKLEEIENKLRAIKNVSDVQVTGMTRTF